MDLNKISVQPRARSSWEALDLGLIMTRQWWQPIFLSWLIPSFLTLVVFSLIFYQKPWISMLIVWWLKPLWDRGPLYVASKNLFGENVSLREVLLKLPELYKIEWLISLTWRRLSPTRSFDMPLTILEKVSGKKRSTRQAYLHRQYYSGASWLTITCIHLETFFVLATLSLVYLMVPDSIQIDFLGIFIEGNTLLDWATNYMTLAGMAIIGAYYSVAGFALYISRRIELEAWDIEIHFKNLLAATSATKTPSKSFSKVNLTIGVISSLLLFSPSPQSYAADTNVVDSNANFEERFVESAEASQARSQIMTILEKEQFHQIEESSGWRLKNPSSENFPEWFVDIIEGAFWIGDKLSFIGDFFVWISPFLEFILWALAALIIGFVIYHFRKAKMKRIFQNNVTAQEEIPKALFGLDISQDSLPDDIPENVKNLWLAEDFRAAVSLLYRAMLSGLIHQHGFKFSDGHTEGECVKIVARRGNQEITLYSKQLTLCWQQIAYGHLVPETNQVKQLCQNWENIFPNE